MRRNILPIFHSEISAMMHPPVSSLSCDKIISESFKIGTMQKMEIFFWNPDLDSYHLVANEVELR